MKLPRRFPISISSKPMFPRKQAFTLVEMAIVTLLMAVILLATYKIFFSQARIVAQSMEYMRINDSFRRVQMHIGNDIHEATWILEPAPVRLEETSNLVTPKLPARVLYLVKQEIDPSIKPVDPLTAKPLATSTFNQLARVREIIYELQPRPPKPNEEDVPNTAQPLMRLVRTELIHENGSPGIITKQEAEISDNIRDFVLFRTARKPMQAADLAKPGDRLLESIPSHIAGTGRDVVHLRLTLQKAREKGNKSPEMFEISLSTSYYKRGKEVFFHQ